MDYFEISSRLEKHHAIFYQFWRCGKPVFTDEIPTAAIRFRDHSIEFLFNKKFYNSLTDYEKEFVICHEMLHIILNHGKRLNDTKHDRNLANIAFDVVINELLVEGFGFNKTKLGEVIQQGCWMNTIFPKNDFTLVEEEREAEYYYLMLQGDNPPTFTYFDVHDFLNDNSDKMMQETMEKIADNLSDEEVKEIVDKVKSCVSEDKPKRKYKNNAPDILSGSGIGGIIHIVNRKKNKPKKKWETVIKKWALKFKLDIKNSEHWAALNRRFSMLPEDICIPSEMEEFDLEEPNKIEVMFFLDTSGSCWHLKDRFWAAANSLSKDRFNLQLLNFDTQVFKTSLKSKKIYGGGGTKFDIIEDFIQKELKNKKIARYPFVFVITDGYGNPVSPQIPKNWYVFLSSNYTTYVKDMNIFNLSNFE